MEIQHVSVTNVRQDLLFAVLYCPQTRSAANKFIGGISEYCFEHHYNVLFGSVLM